MCNSFSAHLSRKHAYIHVFIGQVHAHIVTWTGTDTCIHIFTWTDTGTHKYVLPGQVRIHTHISAHTLKAVDSVMGGATYIVIQWVS